MKHILAILTFLFVSIPIIASARPHPHFPFPEVPEPAMPGVLKTEVVGIELWFLAYLIFMGIMAVSFALFAIIIITERPKKLYNWLFR